ncbi:MAG TPA: tetratricopeptide repeat protein [Methylomirabilota bacterium]|jgi:tetratricopeptide (TPR) repeat protein|nr:tetratricopeptide repeat protein [Methylomirabilota bacterium]
MRTYKRLLFTVIAAVTLIAVRVQWFRSEQSLSSPGSSLSPIASPTTMAAETPADRAIRAAETAVGAQPQQSAGYVALATAYMQKARESGDAGYYGRAEAAVQRALSLQPDAVEALRTLAWVQTGKHEFREALATAEQLRGRLPNDPLVYGLLSDAAIELGEYERAEEAVQTMLDLHPGVASYSRAAYLRELYGDLAGATALMEQAVKASSPRDPEPFAWCLVQLGHLYFNQGRVGKAETAYNNALAVFPYYYQALAALGRVRSVQQRYAEAIALYQQAVGIVPAPDLAAALGDLLWRVGQYDEAEKQYALVEYIEHVHEINQVAYNRQLALFYADHNRNLDEAVALAETEARRRHDVYSFDTLAWVYYKKGRFADAQQAMTQALRLGTQDAELLFHAGMIAKELGQAGQAKDYLQRALELNPDFSLRDGETARQTLAELEHPTMAQGEGYVR